MVGPLFNSQNVFKRGLLKKTSYVSMGTVHIAALAAFQLGTVAAIAFKHRKLSLLKLLAVNPLGAELDRSVQAYEQAP